MPAAANTLTQHADFNALANNSVVSQLDGNYGVLSIQGIDSAKFLQGQLTCNVQEVTAQQARRGAHCTHKGRMVASFYLMQISEQHYLFVLPLETLSALQKSLQKYIVFSKAKLSDATNEYILRGISGENAAKKITDIFGAAPTAALAQISHENGTAICIDSHPARFLCIIPSASQTQFDEALSASLTSDAHYWNWLDIASGFGTVRADTIEEFIPQMLNLQVLDGVSFTKGCYTGQEIVARMQYRGILKKAMYRIGGAGVTPIPNTAIFQAENTQAVGHIVCAENSNSTQWQALAVINHDAIEHTLTLENSSDIAVLPLPYSITEK